MCIKFFGNYLESHISYKCSTILSQSSHFRCFHVNCCGSVYQSIRGPTIWIPIVTSMFSRQYSHLLGRSSIIKVNSRFKSDVCCSSWWNQLLVKRNIRSAAIYLQKVGNSARLILSPYLNIFRSENWTVFSNHYSVFVGKKVFWSGSLRILLNLSFLMIMRSLICKSRDNVSF